MFEKTRFVNSNHYKSSEEEVMHVVDQEASQRSWGLPGPGSVVRSLVQKRGCGSYRLERLNPDAQADVCHLCGCGVKRGSIKC